MEWIDEAIVLSSRPHGENATVVMLLTYVLPQFTPIFEQAGAKLPRPTRILIAVGDIVRDDGMILFALLLVGVFALMRFLSRWQKVVSSVPSLLPVFISTACLRSA